MPRGPQTDYYQFDDVLDSMGFVEGIVGTTAAEAAPEPASAEGAQCIDPTKPKPEIKDDGAMAKILGNYDVPTCDRSSSAAAMVTLGGAGGAVHNSSKGCETVNIMAQENKSLQNNMQCMMSKLSNSAKVSSKQANKIEFINKGTLVGCNVSTNQSNAADVKVVASLSADVQKDMKAMVQNSAEQQLTQAAKVDTGFMGSSDGAKQLADIKNETVQNNIAQSMDDIANEIEMQAKQLNEGKFINEGTWVCGPDGKIEINQENLAKMQAQMIMNTLMKTMTENLATNDMTQKVEQTAETTAGGIPPLFGGMFIVVIIVILVVMFS